jgi:hypothetical protein
MNADARPTTAGDLEALRVELREALTNVMDEVVNAVKSVSPPLSGQLRAQKSELAQRMERIEREQEDLLRAMGSLRAEIVHIGDRLSELEHA